MSKIVERLNGEVTEISDYKIDCLIITAAIKATPTAGSVGSLILRSSCQATALKSAVKVSLCLERSWGAIFFYLFLCLSSIWPESIMSLCR